MKGVTKTFTIVGALCVVAISSSVSGFDETAPVLGRLAIQGAIGIHAGAGEIEVTAPSYPYRAGERIATRPQSEAVLTLRDGSIAIAPETKVSIAGHAARYRIELERGALRIRLGARSVFDLASGEVRMRFPSSLEDASDAGTPVDVMIAVEEDGVVAAESYRGAVELSEPGAGSPRILSGGESDAFGNGTGPVSAEREEGLRDKLAPWLIGTGAVVGAGGLGTGIYYLTDDDRDESPRTSPVR